MPAVPEIDRESLVRDIQSQLKVPERFDPTALEQQIGGLQKQIAGLPQPQQIDVEALRSDILGRVPTFDPTGLQARLGALESREIPTFDPSGLQQQIAANKALLENLPQPQQIDVGALRSDILSRVPQFDPSSLQREISQLRSQIGNIPSPQQIDVEALRRDILSQVPRQQSIDVEALKRDILSSIPQQQSLPSIPKINLPSIIR